MARHRASVVVILFVTILAASTVRGMAATSPQRPQGAKGRIDLTGAVLKVDTESRSMTLRSGSNTVSFDISNAVLRGYNSIWNIKKGDRVAAGYTADGIHITKLSKVPEKDLQQKPSVAKSPAESTNVTPPARKPKKPSPFARRMKTDGKSFADVDNNKDGKISPVELSVVVPTLTMEQFHQYDKNHDGHLDRAEFGQVKLP